MYDHNCTIYQWASREQWQLSGSERGKTGVTASHKSSLCCWRPHVDPAGPSDSLHMAQMPSQQSEWLCCTHLDQDILRELLPLCYTDETVSLTLYNHQINELSAAPTNSPTQLSSLIWSYSVTSQNPPMLTFKRQQNYMWITWHTCSI